LLFTFDESLNVIFERAAGLNLGLEKLVEEGLVIPAQIDPAELTPGS
jgi:hypothetical protein